MNSTAKLAQLIRALQAYEPERIVLFGSYARGEEDELSDIDLVVFKNTSVPFFERLKAVSRLLPPSVTRADLFVYTPEEFEHMLEEGNAFAELVAEQGRVVYERQTQV